MLDGRDAGLALGNDRAAVCGHYVFGQSVDDGLVLEVDTLDLVSVSGGRGEETGSDLESGVETFAGEGELAVESNLIHILE